MQLNEFCDDPEIYYPLHERGGRSGSKNSDAGGAGDRAVAGKNRVSGLSRLRFTIPHAIEALRAGGWNGDRLHAEVMNGSHTELPGREWSLKGAIAEAVIFGSCSNPNAELAEESFHDKGTPENAIYFMNVQGGLTLTIRYLSDGSAANAVKELAAELRNAGIDATETQ